MPNRVLREKILESKGPAALDDRAELFLYKSFSVVDDYGRIECDPELLRVKLYPRKLANVTVEDVDSFLKQCCAGEDPLMLVYRVGNRLYLEIQKFRQQVRAVASKCPSPAEGELSSDYHPTAIRLTTASECQSSAGGQ